jgi:hypothetical protein
VRWRAERGERRGWRRGSEEGTVGRRGVGGTGVRSYLTICHLYDGHLLICHPYFGSCIFITLLHAKLINYQFCRRSLPSQLSNMEGPCEIPSYPLYWISITTGIKGLCRVSGTLGKAQITLGKRHSAAISSAKASLPSVFCRALGKGFAEYQKNTRQREALGKM